MSTASKINDHLNRLQQCFDSLSLSLSLSYSHYLSLQLYTSKTSFINLQRILTLSLYLSLTHTHTHSHTHTIYLSISLIHIHLFLKYSIYSWQPLFPVTLFSLLYCYYIFLQIKKLYHDTHLLTPKPFLIHLKIKIISYTVDKIICCL